jgi:hypothetical protein
LVAPGVRVGASTPDTSRIIELTDKAISAEIELERNYIQFRILGSKEPKFRRLRYFMLQEAAAGSFITSSTIGLCEYAKGFKDPAKVTSRPLRISYNVGVLGTAFGGGSSALELCSNILIAVKNKLRHHDPASAQDRFRERLAVLDQHLRERAELVAKVDERSLRTIYEHEGTVLKEFRDWCIYEFADVYADIKSYEASNNVFYALDIGINSMSAASYLYSLRGLKKPGAYGASAVTGAIGDSISTISGPAGTVAGNMIYNYWYNRLTKNLKENVHDADQSRKLAMKQLEDIVTKAETTTKAEAGPLETRLKVYRHWANKDDRYMDERNKHLQFLSKISLQQNVGGPLISLGSLSGDVMNLVGFYKYGERPRGYNNLSFASSVSGVVSSSASATLTATTLIREKRFEHKLRKENGLPEQLLDERLRTLDELDAMLQSTRR